VRTSCIKGDRTCTKSFERKEKKLALLALKKKRYQEQLLSKTEAQLSNIQGMIDSIEFAQMELKVFEGLKQGNAVLKEIHSQMSIEEIDNLMLDTQEAIAYQNQIEEALSGKLTDEDEEAVMAEFDALEKEFVKTSLPSVPTEELPQGETAEGENVEEPEPQPVKTRSKGKQKQAELA